MSEVLQLQNQIKLLRRQSNSSFLKMESERVGKTFQIILSNNFSYTGVVLSEDDFFIVIKDKFGLQVSLGKKDIQVLKEIIK